MNFKDKLVRFISTPLGAGAMVIAFSLLAVHIMGVGELWPLSLVSGALGALLMWLSTREGEWLFPKAAADLMGAQIADINRTLDSKESTRTRFSKIHDQIGEINSTLNSASDRLNAAADNLTAATDDLNAAADSFRGGVRPKGLSVTQPKKGSGDVSSSQTFWDDLA